jgi:hypothetical protein
MLSEFWSKLSRRTAGSADAPQTPPTGRGPEPIAHITRLPTAEKPGITFEVDAVTLAQNLIKTERLEESLLRSFQRKIIVFDEPERHVIAGSGRSHSLIHAVHQAFSQHYPLTLSPDAVWLTISQGFGHHVTENSEEFRHRLVRHEGRRTLRTTSTGLMASDFQRAIADFSSQIRDETDPVLYETLICDFSTTTGATRTASEVALMDTYSSYFDYAMMCVCGIPEITIEGTVEDWRRIRARAEVLETFGLGWWVSRLRPILDEFVLAADRQPTLNFWKGIYKPQEAYGDTAITGWIADLFPYLGDKPGRVRNPVFEHERHEWALPVDEGLEMDPFGPDAGVQKKRLPCGLSSVPLSLEFMDGSRSNVDLVAGFFAVEQAASDFSLAPVIGWSVAEPAPKEPIPVF